MPVVGSEKLEFAGDPQATLVKPETHRQNNTLGIWLANNQNHTILIFQDLYYHTSLILAMN